ncbi:MAG: hypothetical protein M3Z33_10575 [Actinomycetota bacterium]|nr:hypothetical protein [Actinomycetota bacterium]
MNTPNDPPPQTAAGPADPDPLDALRERIRSTQDAVERLADEAARATGAARERSRGEGPPPRGYAVPGDEPDRGASDLGALVALLEVVRAAVPRELTEQLADLLREVLLLARAAIDWYLERLEPHSRAPVEVQDIPIS